MASLAILQFDHITTFSANPTCVPAESYLCARISLRSTPSVPITSDLLQPLGLFPCRPHAWTLCLTLTPWREESRYCTGPSVSSSLETYAPEHHSIRVVPQKHLGTFHIFDSDLHDVRGLSSIASDKLQLSPLGRWGCATRGL